MENEYWNNKTNQDRMYGDIQHQEAMNSLVTENEYKIASLLRPKLFIDGDKWCCLYGDNLQEGVAGFGDSPHLAILDFNKAMQTGQVKNKPSNPSK